MRLFGCEVDRRAWADDASLLPDVACLARYLQDLYPSTLLCSPCSDHRKPPQVTHRHARSPGASCSHSLGQLDAHALRFLDRCLDPDTVWLISAFTTRHPPQLTSCAQPCAVHYLLGRLWRLCGFRSSPSVGQHPSLHRRNGRTSRRPPAVLARERNVPGWCSTESRRKTEGPTRSAGSA